MKILSLLQLFAIPFGFVPNCPAVKMGYPEQIQMTVTAYCPCKKCCGIWAKKGVNEKGERITASKHVIKQGDKFCAADKLVPFGTTIEIPDYGTVPVLDRGGDIKENRIDVFFNSHQDALNWGERELTVKIWNYGIQN